MLSSLFFFLYNIDGVIGIKAKTIQMGISIVKKVWDIPNIFLKLYWIIANARIDKNIKNFFKNY